MSKFIPYRNIRRLLVLFISIGIISIILVGTIYSIGRTNIKNETLLHTNNDIDIFKSTFTNNIASINSDVIMIKDLLSLKNSLEIDGTSTVFKSPADQEIIENEFSVWISRKNIYDQIRIIDNTGQEILRINRTDDIPEIVDENLLQNKATRYYFLESIILDKNQLYVSKLDLNVENNEIELINGEPKPMMRFAATIFDDSGNKLGIIIINYLAADILDSLKETKLVDYACIEMINEDGYYLFSDNEEKLFGFMYDDKSDEVYSKYHDYDIFNNTSSIIGQSEYSGGNYTSVMITAESLSSKTLELSGIAVDVILGSEDYFIVSSFDISDIPEIKDLNLLFTYISILVILVVALVSRILDELFFYKEEQLKIAEYSATHDILTNIPNRLNIQNLIGYKVTRGVDFSLLYIDFDGFKNINDSFGHSIGDKALIAGVKRIQDSVRLDDVVARVGGDEFLVLINGVTDKTILSRICTTLLNNFKIDFNLDGCICKMGLSIGVSIHPKDSVISEELIKNADKAMYEIKNEGKNNFKFYADTKNKGEN